MFNIFLVKFCLTIQNTSVELVGFTLLPKPHLNKIALLELFNTLVNEYSPFIDTLVLGNVMREIVPLVNEADLSVVIPTLKLILLVAQKKHCSSIHDVIMKNVLNLLRSQILQQATLECLWELFETLVRARLPHTGYQKLLVLLSANVSMLKSPGNHKSTSHF